METEVRCPKCGETKIIKHGVSKTGRQRYYCQNEKCTAGTFQTDYAYNGCKPETERIIKEMAADENGIRATSRTLAISAYKVMVTLKKTK